ncbi:EamA family transporter [Candidatus Pristimantibacillus sp. PTI5]|uniref:EamA family transporter n=1 Tax=Candidatus Pristimantibacillus sp. PTI5 TaxID=3400422 RepID=UPI003B022F4B
MQSSINFIYLLLSIIFQSAAFILSKFAAVDLQTDNIISLLFNSNYIFSIICLAFQAVFWQLTLRKIELSIAYPLTSLNNVFILVASFIIFKEQITYNNILGVSIIMAGIVILNLKRETK